MKLTIENATQILPGDVVKFSWTTSEGKCKSRIGVIYGNDAFGIKCNEEGGTYFGYGRKMFDGHIEFEILSDHAPVTYYGMKYDFVSNCQ